jgi:hypothetical protein
VTREEKLVDALRFSTEMAIEFLEDYISELEIRVATKDPAGLGWEFAQVQLAQEREHLIRLQATTTEYLEDLKKN